MPQLSMTRSTDVEVIDMPWGIFKAADADDNDPGPAKDDINLAKNLDKISKLGGIKNRDERKEAAHSLLADVNAIVERGKARRAANENRRKGK